MELTCDTGFQAGEKKRWGKFYIQEGISIAVLCFISAINIVLVSEALGIKELSELSRSIGWLFEISKS
jgi:hypothetical protein